MSDQLMTRSADERLDRLEADVAEIKDTLNDRVLGTLAEHGESLAEHGEILAGHGETLAEHGEILAGHGETLAKHGEILAKHGEILAENGERLEALEVGQRGLQDELHYVKVRVDAIADHFGIA